MIIVLKPGATKAQADELLAKIEGKGLKSLYMPGSERTVLGALGDERVLSELALQGHPLVESVQPILAPYKLVSREVQAADTVIPIGSSSVGGKRFMVAAGPCSVESKEQMLGTAEAVVAAGAHALRGGAFKPRTSPYSFQGLGLEGLKILQQAGSAVELPIFTEVVDVSDVDAVDEHAQVFQVGARNMQNYRLLSALGERRKPVLLKRGMSATIKELLLAAEYIVSGGNSQVILCERGIRTFGRATRNTLDLNAVPYIKQKSHLPVIVDPSHGTGRRDLIRPMSLAAAACGADGLIVEVHRDPSQARSDGEQSLYPEQFANLMQALGPVVAAVGKQL
jgi:3-deoxy-7-phosphoheptulonate synthase